MKLSWFGVQFPIPGRLATADLREIVRKSSPLFNFGIDQSTEIFIIVPKFEVHRCKNCRFLARRMSKCSRCRAVRYCSEACQRAHWPSHRVVCSEHGMWSAPAWTRTFFQSCMLANCVRSRCLKKTDFRRLPLLLWCPKLFIGVRCSLTCQMTLSCSVLCTLC